MEESRNKTDKPAIVLNKTEQKIKSQQKNAYSSEKKIVFNSVAWYKNRFDIMYFVHSDTMLIGGENKRSLSAILNDSISLWNLPYKWQKWRETHKDYSIYLDELNKKEVDEEEEEHNKQQSDDYDGTLFALFCCDWVVELRWYLAIVEAVWKWNGDRELNASWVEKEIWNE